MCLCGWAGPFPPCGGTCCNEEGSQCYHFPLTYVFLTARDGGTKFECLLCGEFELEEAPPGGTPQSVEMQRS